MRTGICPSLLVVLGGLLFCVLNLFRPGQVFCAGSGCEVYADLEFLGLSFYAWGVLLFLALILVRHRPWFPMASTLALAADLPFLAWQAAFIPCSSCLTVSVLLTINAGLARVSTRAGRLFLRLERGAGLKNAVIGVAVLLIVVGATSVLKEKIRPWSINDAPPESSRLFFSPSCEPCREHMEVLFTTGQLGKIALIPVAREQKDTAQIAALQHAFAVGGQTAFMDSLRLPPPVDDSADPVLRMRLMWNHATLIRSGGASLPWMVGAPDYAPPTRGRTSTSAPERGQSSLGCDLTPGRCTTPTQELSW